MIKRELRFKIGEKSISLGQYGLDEFAWTKEDAKKFISSIMEDDIGIFGGDVYKLFPNHLEPLCDNWACERKLYESEEEYYLRSKKESINYIESYPTKNDEKILFSLVFTEQLAPDSLPADSNPDKLACRVCGKLQEDLPWGEDGETPTFDVCYCCGVQFGYEDCDAESLRKFRQTWLAKGANWFVPEEKPDKWELEEQMKKIPERYR